MLTLFATLTQDELEILYELTYKYGWLVAKERQERWLPDKGYLMKNQIEYNLATITKHSLEELITVFDDYLQYHNGEGIKEQVKQILNDTNFITLQQHIASQFGFDVGPIIYDIISANVPVDQFFANRNITKVVTYNNNYSSFIEWYDKSGVNPEEVDLLSTLPDTEKVDYISNFLKAEFIGWLTTITFDFKDYLVNNEGVRLLSTGYGAVVKDNADFIADFAVSEWRALFGEDLQKSIARIADTKQYMEEALGSNLSQQIIAFQAGLNTAHVNGTMADHLLGTSAGGGKQILDELSSGTKVQQWDKELSYLMQLE